jgi:hypothetical protein
VRLSADALAFLSVSGRIPPQELGGYPLPAGVNRELERVQRALMRVHLEKDLRSARVLRDLQR